MLWVATQVSKIPALSKLPLLQRYISAATTLKQIHIIQSCREISEMLYYLRVDLKTRRCSCTRLKRKGSFSILTICQRFGVIAVPPVVWPFCYPHVAHRRPLGFPRPICGHIFTIQTQNLLQSCRAHPCTIQRATNRQSQTTACYRNLG